MIVACYPSRRKVFAEERSDRYRKDCMAFLDVISESNVDRAKSVLLYEKKNSLRGTAMRMNMKKKKTPQEAETTGTVAEKVMSRSKRAHYTPTHLRMRKLSWKERMFLLIPALAAILAVVIVMLTVNKGSKYRLPDTAYQYYGGNSAWIESGSELRRGVDGTSILKSGNRMSETTLPIYLEHSRKVVFPTDMLYITPRSGGCDRVAYFSEVECKANSMITITRAGTTKNTEQGFLYDGEDFYLFLEPVTLKFNGYTMDLPALSYAEAVFGGYMMLFNYDTKEFFIELSDGTGTAQPPSGDYVISLLGDSMTLSDGSQLLLATRPDLFDPSA